jgi:hypothetical protein
LVQTMPATTAGLESTWATAPIQCTIAGGQVGGEGRMGGVRSGRCGGCGYEISLAITGSSAGRVLRLSSHTT